MEQWEVGEGMQALKESVPMLLLCKCSIVTLGPSNVNFNSTGNSYHLLLNQHVRSKAQLPAA